MHATFNSFNSPLIETRTAIITGFVINYFLICIFMPVQNHLKHVFFER